MLDLSTFTWETKSPYPFESEIHQASIIYMHQSFMLFGGFNTSGWYTLSRIAAYNPHTDEWTSKGHLLSPRARYGVISVVDEFIIIGGYTSGQRSSEKCRYNGEQLECGYQNPTQPGGKYFYKLYYL